MDNSFWRKQQPKTPLFPDILWSRPERRDLAGKLTIIGGNSNSFAAVANAYQLASKLGVGSIKIILPEVLKKTLPSSFVSQIPDVIFAPSNHSGGFSAQAIDDWRSAAGWSDLVIFIGDNGANSETAALMEQFLATESCSVILTRDSVDLIHNAAEQILNRPNTHMVLSLSQLQKLFKAVYYPKILTFSQGIVQVAETLHKFTITYPSTISLWHSDNLFVAQNGEVITEEFIYPLRVWSGEVAIREGAWQLWQPDTLKAVAASWTEL